MKKKRIVFLTGTRADFGKIKSLILGFQKNKKFRVSIFATGMHLSPEFGLTFREIEKDGFLINRKIEMLISSDTTVGIAKSMGLQQALEHVKLITPHTRAYGHSSWASIAILNAIV